MRHVCLSIGALLLSVASALGQGCGPTRLKVAESVTLDMPPARAWALVGNFQDTSWDAETTGASGRGGNTPDEAVRTVTLRDGTALGESLYKYDPGTMSYAYHVDRVDVTRLPVQNASATLEVVQAEGGAKSTVRWKFVFYRNLAPGEGTPDAADARAVDVMRRFMRAGLDGLGAKVQPRT